MAEVGPEAAAAAEAQGSPTAPVRDAIPSPSSSPAPPTGFAGVSADGETRSGSLAGFQEAYGAASDNTPKGLEASLTPAAATAPLVADTQLPPDSAMAGPAMTHEDYYQLWMESQAASTGPDAAAAAQGHGVYAMSKEEMDAYAAAQGAAWQAWYEQALKAQIRNPFDEKNRRDSDKNADPNAKKSQSAKKAVIVDPMNLLAKSRQPRQRDASGALPVAKVDDAGVSSAETASAIMPAPMEVDEIPAAEKDGDRSVAKEEERQHGPAGSGPSTNGQPDASGSDIKLKLVLSSKSATLFRQAAAQAYQEAAAEEDAAVLESFDMEIAQEEANLLSFMEEQQRIMEAQNALIDRTRDLHEKKVAQLRQAKEDERQRRIEMRAREEVERKRREEEEALAVQREEEERKRRKEQEEEDERRKAEEYKRQAELEDRKRRSVRSKPSHRDESNAAAGDDSAPNGRPALPSNSIFDNSDEEQEETHGDGAVRRTIGGRDAPAPIFVPPTSSTGPSGRKRRVNDDEDYGGRQGEERRPRDYENWRDRPHPRRPSEVDSRPQVAYRSEVPAPYRRERPRDRNEAEYARWEKDPRNHRVARPQPTREGEVESRHLRRRSRRDVNAASESDTPARSSRRERQASPSVDEYDSEEDDSAEERRRRRARRRKQAKRRRAAKAEKRRRQSRRSRKDDADSEDDESYSEEEEDSDERGGSRRRAKKSRRHRVRPTNRRRRRSSRAEPESSEEEEATASGSASDTGSASDDSVESEEEEGSPAATNKARGLGDDQGRKASADSANADDDETLKPGSRGSEAPSANLNAAEVAPVEDTTRVEPESDPQTKNAPADEGADVANATMSDTSERPRDRKGEGRKRINRSTPKLKQDVEVPSGNEGSEDEQRGDRRERRRRHRHRGGDKPRADDEPGDEDASGDDDDDDGGGDGGGDAESSRHRRRAHGHRRRRDRREPPEPVAGNRKRRRERDDGAEHGGEGGKRRRRHRDHDDRVVSATEDAGEAGEGDGRDDRALDAGGDGTAAGRPRTVPAASEASEGEEEALEESAVSEEGSASGGGGGRRRRGSSRRSRSHKHASSTPARVGEPARRSNGSRRRR
ncbi:hypothetical protein HK405_008870 [Cladochytrium tenue]|nr:hypothetical protein HK405_008870 [Cladochytrium tenue]